MHGLEILSTESLNQMLRDEMEYGKLENVQAIQKEILKRKIEEI